MSRKNATVLAFGDYRAKPRTLYFTRSELNQLLGLYSRQVARGIWRDYAIDRRDRRRIRAEFVEVEQISEVANRRAVGRHVARRLHRVGQIVTAAAREWL